jgi:hypothetical protein
MARQRGKKKAKASRKRIVLTFTESPQDQALYTALKKTAATDTDDKTLCPRLIKSYLREVCGLRLPDYSMLQRMGLPEDEAYIYSVPDGNPFRTARENQRQLKNMLKALEEMDLLTKNITKRVFADPYRKMLLDEEGIVPSATPRKAKKQAA